MVLVWTPPRRKTEPPIVRSPDGERLGSVSRCFYGLMAAPTCPSTQSVAAIRATSGIGASASSGRLRLRPASAEPEDARDRHAEEASSPHTPGPPAAGPRLVPQADGSTLPATVHSLCGRVVTQGEAAPRQHAVYTHEHADPGPGHGRPCSTISL